MAQRAGRLSFARLRAQFTKEVLCTLRDPRSRMVVFMPPLLQLLVFAFAARWKCGTSMWPCTTRTRGVGRTN